MTQNPANKTQPVSVQKVVDGQTVTSSYVDGEPVLGTSELVPDADETLTDNDDASVEDAGRGADDGEEQ